MAHGRYQRSASSPPATSSEPRDNLVDLLNLCDEEFTSLVEQYNASKSALLQLSETERAKNIRQYVIIPLAVIFIIGAAAASLTFYLLSKYSGKDDMKPLFDRLCNISFWAAIGGLVLQNFVTSPSDSYSVFFRVLTRKLGADDMHHYERMLFSFDRLRTYLMEAYGENNPDMRLIYLELQRIHLALQEQRQPVRSAIEILNFAGDVMLQIQHMLHHRTPNFMSRPDYLYNGRLFHAGDPDALEFSVQSDLEAGESTLLVKHPGRK